MTALYATSWVELAACRGRPTAWWWFSPPESWETQVAKSICRRCPVREQCLGEALALEADDGPVFGVRGGLTAGERRAIVSV